MRSRSQFPLTSLRGVGLLITNGSTISITNEAFTNFARADFLGIPSLFWMVILVAVPAYVFLHLSRWGRYLFAVGSNSEAARLSGVSVNRTIYMAYILSATCAAFVGVLLASRIGIQQSDLSRMEKGEYRVSLDTLFKILAEFDISIGEFFDEMAKDTFTPQDVKLVREFRSLEQDDQDEVRDFIQFKRHHPAVSRQEPDEPED